MSEMRLMGAKALWASFLTGALAPAVVGGVIALVGEETRGADVIAILLFAAALGYYNLRLISGARSGKLHAHVYRMTAGSIGFLAIGVVALALALFSKSTTADDASTAALLIVAAGAGAINLGCILRVMCRSWPDPIPRAAYDLMIPLALTVFLLCLLTLLTVGVGANGESISERWEWLSGFSGDIAMTVSIMSVPHALWMWWAPSA